MKKRSDANERQDWSGINRCGCKLTRAFKLSKNENAWEKKKEGISEGEWPGKQKWRLRRWSGEGNRSGRGRRAVWRRGWTSILPPCISSSLFLWPFLWWVFFSFKPKTISRFGGFGEVSERASETLLSYIERDTPILYNTTEEEIRHLADCD